MALWVLTQKVDEYACPMRAGRRVVEMAKMFVRVCLHVLPLVRVYSHRGKRAFCTLPIRAIVGWTA